LQGGLFGGGVVFKIDPAQQLTTLYSFSGPDGRLPNGTVIRDGKGNLYGTAENGGTNDAGVVYKLDTTNTETVLYSFTGGIDGKYPIAGLLRGSRGELYGTTRDGGDANLGVVFKLGTGGKETVLHSFTGTPDGATTFASVIKDETGNLYGTTQKGGDSNLGIAFKLRSGGRIVIQHSFTGGGDGGGPFGGLVRGPNGQLFGTAVGGGNKGGTCGQGGCGVVFKIGKAGNLTVLYTFAGSISNDGALPMGRLVRDAQGNLYGTTYSGGSTGCGGGGCGTVFKLDSSAKESILYRFTGGSDGAQPQAGLFRAEDGTLYGTTPFGGGVGGGVAFKITFP
jgi:uncharacterized repeat protein (TIGR03803 family)